MDQQLTHHTPFYVNEEDQFHLNLEPAASLKTVSRSEPHLRIPHLLVSQDEDHPSLNRIVSGLFHVSNALHTPHASCGNLEALRSIKVVPATESTSVSAQPTALRKSSSAVDWSAVADTSKSSKQWYLECEDLSKTTSRSQSTASGLMLQQYSQDKPTSSSDYHRHGHVASSASPTQPPPSSSLNSENKGHHAFGGVFHRGFFSKPVVRSEEENYRYLMALDR